MYKKNSLVLNVENSMQKLNPVFILVNPQMAENIGAAARAMLNFGFLNLRLVSPRENHLSDRALAMAAGAGRVLDQAQVFKNVADACKDLNEVLATSARDRYKYKDVVDPKELLPRDSNSEFAKLNPMGAGDLQQVNLLKAGHHIGIDTVGQSLRNANLQLRSEPANPKMDIGPWNNSTISGDTMRRPLEIGN